MDGQKNKSKRVAQRVQTQVAQVTKVQLGGFEVGLHRLGLESLELARGLLGLLEAFLRFGFAAFWIHPWLSKKGSQGVEQEEGGRTGVNRKYKFPLLSGDPLSNNHGSCQGALEVLKGPLGVPFHCWRRVGPNWSQVGSPSNGCLNQL